jgi:hypothetical protein
MEHFKIARKFRKYLTIMLFSSQEKSAETGLAEVGDDIESNVTCIQSNKDDGKTIQFYLRIQFFFILKFNTFFLYLKSKIY